MKKIILLGSIFCCLASSATLPSNIPATGIVGYWPFDGNANDIGPHANNGTVYGATQTTDRFNSPNHAYNFNGSSDYIKVPNNVSLSGFTDITISAWIKTNAFNGVQCIAAKWWQQLNCGGNSDTYEVAIDGNNVNLATNLNNYGLQAYPTLSTNDLNVWRHLTFVYNSSSAAFSIYIDGTLAHSEGASGSGICASTNDLFFGADWEGNASYIYRFFNGAIDDIGIWNRALTPCEIANLYAPPAESHPVVVTSVANPSNISNAPVISQNEPNPFVRETTIRYNLPEKTQQSALVITDLSGTELASYPLIKGGKGSVTVTSDKLASGVYLYSVISGDKKIIQSKKMIISK